MSTEEGKHEPHFDAQPVKPALKDDKGKKKKKEKKALTWDEHAIEEHDLLRGTRMKVSVFLCVVFVELFNGLFSY